MKFVGIPLMQLLVTQFFLMGTWQKRGFALYNGAVVAMSIPTGKIIDVEAISRYCQACI